MTKPKTDMVKEELHDELRHYAHQFTFRCGLTKEDDKPFFCMCPKCYISNVWKNEGILGVICYLIAGSILWDIFKHEQSSKTIVSYDVYPKF